MMEGFNSNMLQHQLFEGNFNRKIKHSYRRLAVFMLGLFLRWREVGRELYAIEWGKNLGAKTLIIKYYELFCLFNIYYNFTTNLILP